MQNSNRGVPYQQWLFPIILIGLLLSGFASAQVDLSKELRAIVSADPIVIEKGDCAGEKFCGKAIFTFTLVNPKSTPVQFALFPIADTITLEPKQANVPAKSKQKVAVNITINKAEAAPAALNLLLIADGVSQDIPVVFSPQPPVTMGFLGPVPIAVIICVLFGTFSIFTLSFFGTKFFGGFWWRNIPANVTKKQIQDGKIVKGKQQWKFDTSWASNFTALSAVVNVTTVISLFSDDKPPTLLTVDQYTLYTLVLGSLFLFSVAVMQLLAGSEPNSQKPPELIIVMAVWIYIVGQGLIIASVGGQLTLLLFLLSDLTTIGLLTDLLFYGGVAVAAIMFFVLMVSSLMTTIDTFLVSLDIPPNPNGQPAQVGKVTRGIISQI
jgi:hypothetical protein